MDSSGGWPGRQPDADQDVEEHHIHVPMAKMRQKPAVQSRQGGAGLFREHGGPDDQKSDQDFRADGDKMVEAGVEPVGSGVDVQVCYGGWQSHAGLPA